MTTKLFLAEAYTWRFLDCHYEWEKIGDYKTFEEARVAVDEFFKNNNVKCRVIRMTPTIVWEVGDD